MKTPSHLAHWTLLAALPLVFLALPAAAQPEPDNCIPTCEETDSRMLALTPGINLATLTDNQVEVQISSPASEAGFQLGFFDGDLSDSTGRWDVCFQCGPIGARIVNTTYTLLADPANDGSGTIVVATFDGDTMPDNDWVDFTVNNVAGGPAQAPSGNFIYRLRIEIGVDGVPPAGFAARNGIKIRSDAVSTIEIFQQPFAYIAAIQGAADIVYPAFPALTPTTYDGNFNFYIELPEPQPKLVLWGGDLDFGSFDCVDLDIDDPNSPLFPDLSLDGFDTGIANPAPEGVALGNLGLGGCQGTGAPFDDVNFPPFLRSPSIVFDINYIEADGSRTLVATNDNPSGNQEWEKFRIDALDNPPAPDPDGPPDATVPSLPAGVYEVALRGLDLENLNAFFFTRLLCQTGDGSPCGSPPDPFVVGDTLFLDGNGNGIQDPGEPGIAGVVVELINQFGLLVTTAVTGDAGNPDFATCQALNTGLDENGLYCFPVNAGDYTVRIAASNFGPGGVLEGHASTTGGETQSNSVIDDNVLTYDFGYELGSVGDRVWLDLDSNGAQDAGEPGLNGVTVRLLDAGGSEIASQITSGDGDYSFDDLPGGDYTVVVDTSTLPPGLAQTFDIDGLGSPDAASFTLGAAENRTDVDFGYTEAGSVCLPDLLFETDAVGNALVAGQIIDNEFSGFGVTVTTSDPANHPAMIFDSANPTGGDYDLGSPNQNFGGPGIGSGGGAGQPGENSRALGKVLIISEDGDSSDPDDDASSGTLIFDFSLGVRVDAVEILDIDEGHGGTVTAFDAGGNVIGTAAMSNVLGNNSFQTVFVGATNVRRLEVFFPGSGAVAGILFCIPPSECSDKTVRDDFDVDSFSNNDGPDTWAGDWIEDDVAGSGPTSGNVKVWGGALKLRDKPDTGTHPSAAREVDLSGSDFASLYFKYDTSSGVDTSDAVVVEVSSNGGATWNVLETFTGIYGASWGERTFDITDYIAPDTQVRFRVTNLYGGSDEWFFVTELEVRGRCTQSCEPVEVSDHFGGDRFDNNDGPDNWSAPWSEHDVAGSGPTSGNVKVWGGFLKLNDYPNTGSEPSAARSVDLSGTTSATLSFDFWTTHGVDSSDAVVVEVSSNGGMSYTTLETFTGISGWSDGWRSYDISSYISSETTVRFRVTNLYGGSDEWFKVDNLTIAAACD